MYLCITRTAGVRHYFNGCASLNQRVCVSMLLGVRHIGRVTHSYGQNYVRLWHSFGRIKFCTVCFRLEKTTTFVLRKTKKRIKNVVEWKT